MTGELTGEQRDLLVAIIRFLQSLEASKAIDTDAIEVAVQCIGEATGVDANTATSDQQALPPLLDVFRTGLSIIHSRNGHPDGLDKFLKALADKGYFAGLKEGTPEYTDKLQRAKQKFFDRHGHPASSDEDMSQIAAAEKLKNKGNALLGNNDVHGAIQAYTEAIAIDSSNAILYGNRAAAYLKLDQLDDAVKDCQRSIELDPLYTKAHYRLGMIYAKLNRKADAKRSYNAALNTVSDHSSALATDIRAALDALDAPPAQNPLDLNAFLSNPMFQQMMSNPDVMNNLMGALMGGDRPQPSAPSSGTRSPPPRSASSSGGGAPFNPMAMLSDPAALNEFLDSPTIKAKEADPELGPLIADLRTNGIGSIAKHLGNPAIMAKLSTLAQELSRTQGASST